MNEVQVTTLLDRLGSQIDVGPAPVERVADAGSRRLRARRSAQIAGIAASVSVITIGGLALRPDHDAAGPTASQQSTWRGTPPTEEQLLGTWRPLVLRGEDVPVRAVDEGRVVLTFTHRMQGIGWSGYDGCNGWGGWVYLGPDGSFATLDNGSTRKVCYARMPFTEVDAVMGAATVRLVNEKLVLYDKSRTPLGVFVRVKQVSPPDRQVRFPGQPPTTAELLGRWRLLGSAEGEPAVVREGGARFISFEGGPAGISYGGSDGCNATGGHAHLDSVGGFSTSRSYTTLRGCVGPDGQQIHQRNAVNVVEQASQVRLVDGNLRFYDHADRLLGILRPFPIIVN